MDGVLGPALGLFHTNVFCAKKCLNKKVSERFLSSLP